MDSLQKEIIIRETAIKCLDIIQAELRAIEDNLSFKNLSNAIYKAQDNIVNKFLKKGEK